MGIPIREEIDGYTGQATGHKSDCHAARLFVVFWTGAAARATKSIERKQDCPEDHKKFFSETAPEPHLHKKVFLINQLNQRLTLRFLPNCRTLMSGKGH